jgi:hypothetical protein
MDRSSQEFCSLLSAAAGEPIIGSAGKTDFYLLLEYSGAWEDKAFEKSKLPEAVKQQLGEFVKTTPAAKVLLIKRSLHSRQGKIHLFVVLTEPHKPRLYRFELDTYEELLDLPLADMCRGDERYTSHMHTGPLYLVCANGRRDLCCARFGLPVYEALKEAVGEDAWECSHIGGHRFAPNVLILPHGVLYGRVQPQQVTELVGQAQAGRMRLENLRGRSAYVPAVQAAEYYLRLKTGERGLDAYHLADATEIEPGRWSVGFIAVNTAGEHQVEILVESDARRVFESCTLDKTTRIITYKLARFDQ